MGKYVHICKMCGKKFEDYSESTKFCTRNCYNKYRKENGKLKDVACPVCDKIFRQSYVGQVFCSIECRVKSTENKVECICNNCGKLFFRKRSEVDKCSNHYCSVECRNAALWWSDDDTKILKDNFGKMSYKDMVNIFSTFKTVDEIKRRAIYIGLTSSRVWSDDEIKILIENYSTNSMHDVMSLLPNRSRSSILGQARVLNLKSFFYLSHTYSQEEDDYLIENYLDKSNDELGKYLHRSSNGIAQHLYVLNLHRPTVIDSYNDLKNYVRSRLSSWKESVRKLCNYTCELTGTHSNIVIHHIRGFNLLISETMDMLDFPMYENISEYSQQQLDMFLETFFQIQDTYHSYICINEDVHKKFHGIYGYGNNTEEQWNEFVNTYYK